MSDSIHKTTEQLAQFAQSFELPATFTPEKRERLFQEILLLDELMGEVRKSAEADDLNHEKLIPLVNQYLTQARCSADIVAALYNEVAFNGRPITEDLQDTVGRAVQNFFVAMKDYADNVDAFLPPDEVNPRGIDVVETLSLEFVDVLEVRPKS